MRKDWFTDFNNSKKIVKSVLRDCIPARGNDKILLLEVWERQGLKLTDGQKSLFKKLIPPETITRARRQIQERRLYRPAKEIYEQRQLLEGEIRNNIS